MTPNPSLYIVESADQAASLLARGSLPSDALVIAAAPAAGEALDAAGVRSTPLESFLSFQQMFKAGTDNNARLEAFCRFSDAFLSQRSGLIKQRRLEPTLWHFTSWKMLLDPFLFRALAIQSVLQRHRPGHLTYFKSASDAILMNGFLHHQDSIPARLIPALAASFPAMALTALDVPPVAAAPKKSFKVALRRYEWVRWLRLSQKVHGLASMLAASLPRRSNPDRLLTLSLDYDLPFIFREMARQGANRVLYWQTADAVFRQVVPFRLRRLPTRRLASPDELTSFTQLWQDLRGQAEFRKFFIWDDLDLFPALERYLRFFYETVAPAAVSTYIEAQIVFDVHAPKAVLSSCLSDPRDVAVFEAARARGIPRVISSHGPYGLPPARMPYYHDYRRTDHFLAWGAGAQEDAARFEPPTPRVHVVGSAMLDDIRGRTGAEKPAARRPLVVFVIFPVLGQTDFLSTEKETRDDFVFRRQKKILRAFKNFPQADYLIKLFPMDIFRQPIENHARRIALPGCRFVQWTPFAQCLGEVDLVVSDYYCTPVVEALAARKRVIVFDDDYPLEAAVRDMEKAVFVAKDETHFQEILGKCLADPAFRPADIREDFLKRFGTHLNDGQSAARALAAIQSISAPGSDVHD